MKKLYRSQKNKKILGICGGLAEYFSIDATIIRLIMIVLLFITFSTWTIVYLLAALVIPIDQGYHDIH